MVEPLNAGVISGAEFVTQYFRKASCDNSSVNTAYSVLSFVLSAVNGFTFDEWLLIKRLFQGTFEERPTFPRCSVIYDIKYVLFPVKHH